MTRLSSAIGWFLYFRSVIEGNLPLTHFKRKAISHTFPWPRSFKDTSIRQSLLCCLNDGSPPNLRVKTILLSSFILLNFGLFGQSHWGFAVASVQVSTGDMLSDYFFVSKVKNLTTMSKLRRSGTDAKRRKSVYSGSLRDWFYSSLRNSSFDVIDIHRDDIVAEVELYSDFPGDNAERYMVTPPDKKQSIFMSRKMASKKRGQFIELARTNGDRVVVIN